VVRPAHVVTQQQPQLSSGASSSKRGRSSTLNLQEMNTDKQAQVASMDLEAGPGGGGAEVTGASGLTLHPILRCLDFGGMCSVAYELWRRIRMEVVVEVGSAWRQPGFGALPPAPVSSLPAASPIVGGM